MTPRGVLAFCRENEVKAVDLRFTDLLGIWQHVTVHVSQLSEASFEHGFAVDTSRLSISNAGDRLVIPQAASKFLDPFASIPTLILIGSLQDPITREDDLLDSRVIAERSLNYLLGTGIADQARIAATCEFQLLGGPLNSDSLDTSARLVQSDAGVDSSLNFRYELMALSIDADMPVVQHFPIDHSGGHVGVEIGSSQLVSAADSIMGLKFIARNTAKRHGRLATFLPKPLADHRGSGMSIQFSLWRGDEPLFGGQEYGGLSDGALLSIGGILHHAAALTAICNPITNSYRRLHYSGSHPFRSGYSMESRETICRIPTYRTDPRGKCVEIRTPDGSCNPYLALAAILMAAIDGIQNKLDPGPAFKSKDNSPLSHPALPATLWDALDCLERDSEFLTRGEVFSQIALDRWLHHKRHVERRLLESNPTLAELDQYLDC